VDFKNTIIIMTSNVGTKQIKETGGFGFSGDTVSDQYENLKNTVVEAMKNLFNPEFLNRIDEAIVFRSLGIDDIKEIIKIEILDLIEHVKNNKMEIELDESAEAFLAEKGFDHKYGARPLKRAIQKYLEDPLSEELLMGNFKEGDKILVKFPGKGEALTFVTASQELKSEINDIEEETGEEDQEPKLDSTSSSGPVE